MKVAPDAILVSAERWRALALPGAEVWRILASATLRDLTILLVGRGAP